MARRWSIPILRPALMYHSLYHIPEYARQYIDWMYRTIDDVIRPGASLKTVPMQVLNEGISDCKVMHHRYHLELLRPIIAFDDFETWLLYAVQDAL